MIGERLQALREQLGKTKKEIAVDLRIHESTYGKYELGRREPDIRMIQLISDYFGTNTDYLLGNTADSSSNVNAIQVPVLGNIPAGIPIEAIEDIHDYEDVPADWGKGGRDYFALKIKGDSMSPEYLDGEVVIFLKSDTCENGDDCAVIINGYDATFKRVVKQLNGVVLQPINVSGYEPTFYSNNDVETMPVQVIGVAVESRRKRGRFR